MKLFSIFSASLFLLQCVNATNVLEVHARFMVDAIENALMRLETPIGAVHSEPSAIFHVHQFLQRIVEAEAAHDKVKLQLQLALEEAKLPVPLDGYDLDAESYQIKAVRMAAVDESFARADVIRSIRLQPKPSPAKERVDKASMNVHYLRKAFGTDEHPEVKEGLEELLASIRALNEHAAAA